MITVEDRGDELHVVDAEKNEVTIQVSDWEPGGTPREIDRLVNKSVVGSVSALRFPEAGVCIETEGEDQWTFFGNDIGPHEIRDGNHLVQFETNVTTYVRFRGSATVQRVSQGSDVIIEFGDYCDVTIGFRSEVQLPPGRITVPPTPKGIAEGVHYLSSAIKTTKPDKSYPSLRGHPPLLSFGETREIPDKIREVTSETDIRIFVPDDFASVFVASPLAYYLQASLGVCTEGDQRLEIPSLGVVQRLPSLPDLQDEIATLLRRSFFLDCLVRNVGPYPADVREFELVDELDLDAEELYDESPEVRFSTYLSVAFEEIASEFPDWHLATFVEPEVSYASSIPYLLDRLSAVFLPEASKIKPTELVEQSLDHAYRSDLFYRWDRPVVSVDPIKPRFRQCRIHGWMADGAPIDAFKMLPKAFSNRFGFIGQSDGRKTVKVVLNEQEMHEELSTVEEVYRQRAKQLSIDVEVARELSKEELIDVFEQAADFVHYIGHCDEGGLRCSDGALPVSKIDDSRVQTFFLNACSSYEEGLELIRKGSVAGAVTLQRVLDEQATRVGTAFAQLVMHGFCIEQALNLAKGMAVLSKGYITVGDGVFSLSQSDDKNPGAIEIYSTNSEDFEVNIGSSPANQAGSVYQPYLDGGEEYLCGNKYSSLISHNKLLSYLSHASGPVIYDDGYFLPNDLIEELGLDKK